VAIDEDTDSPDLFDDHLIKISEDAPVDALFQLLSKAEGKKH
jgi:hypothetical protein